MAVGAPGVARGNGRSERQHGGRGLKNGFCGLLKWLAPKRQPVSTAQVVFLRNDAPAPFPSPDQPLAQPPKVLVEVLGLASSRTNPLI